MTAPIKKMIARILKRSIPGMMNLLCFANGWRPLITADDRQDCADLALVVAPLGMDDITSLEPLFHLTQFFLRSLVQRTPACCWRLAVSFSSCCRQRSCSLRSRSVCCCAAGG